MKKIVIALADGFETVEALWSLDVLRRAGLNVTLSSISNSLNVKSAQGLKVEADTLFDEEKDIDVLILPGGTKAAQTYSEDKRVVSLAKELLEREDKLLCAICASPGCVLVQNDLAKDRSLTGYPGFEYGRKFENEKVVVSGNLITAKSAAFALDFALAILEKVESKSAADKIRKAIQL